MRLPAQSRSRRTWRSDPRLSDGGLFHFGINQQLAAGLPDELQRTYFSPAETPPHWAGAIIENQPNYRARGACSTLNFQGLPPEMVTEFVWCTQRQVQLGLRIHVVVTNRLTRLIAGVVSTDRPDVVSLLDLSLDEWMRAFAKWRMRIGKPSTQGYFAPAGWALSRNLDTLVHAYHQGPWWELDVWNPVLDPRIPLREHEPDRHQIAYFTHLTMPWLREGAKFWLSRQLEREVYTWTTVRDRRYNLKWFQRYVDAVGCDGPHLVDDPNRLGTWIQDFRQWLRKQKVEQPGPRKGQLLGETPRRAAMTALEQLYRFMFAEGAATIGNDDWNRLGPQHAVLFRYGEKPVGPKAPPPELILSDAVISRIAEHSEVIARPVDEGGLGDEQLLRILGLLIRTGRRLNEVAMLDFDPLIAIPFADPDGHVARLRYQQTKIDTGDPTILVDQEIVDLIRQQQGYARNFMAEQGRPGVEPKYLFLAKKQNRNGERPYSDMTGRPLLTKFAKMIDLRDEQGKPVVISKTHTFRHTKATNLLNAGVPLHVAMRYMGHKSPQMFLHYARTLAQTAEREFLRYKKITADGRDHAQDPREMFESIALDKRTDRVLPHGWCLLPPRQHCEKGNACLTCTKFVTDESHEETLVQQRQETLDLIERRQQAHTARYGEPMGDDNVWLRGRRNEAAAIESVLLAIDRVRRGDGTFVPVQGAGAPQQRGEAPGD
ncbi:tyrosine-type recombinase/integrase [Streptomyces albireticuli]|uniref:Tyr recombinase domain-containing protein n=1 Tax=Streptomyces albireticuli TaxID=1940 RepID=A0A2A2D1G2_9ACTN|nr:site-specific integrase [Streptomyces albireticuli]MCD9145870.1 site-specific integrase [Streptomyces albireticuli]MCD9166143.1 site-specific integrase [Streptomyces albireticuli]MCD9189645.1 site-specific integrase [Streptomyces albireticuli]PAU45354.1 hypothetical protein CK936_29940 [Streptomyces albireticuli]